jgi:hypothetical protein
MPHTCHAIGCNRDIPPERLMCYPHWKMVPKYLQRRVWATYRPGQCDDWQPSAEYCSAAKAAVFAVAQAEGIEPDPADPKLVLYDVFRPQEAP